MATRLKTLTATFLFTSLSALSFQTQAADCWKGVCVVESGDTLYSIAKQTDTSWQDIMDNNDIDNPSNLDVGKKLRVAGSSNTEANISDNEISDEGGTSWKSDAPKQETYTVGEGDTLFSIMRTTDVNWKKLAEYNDMTAPYDLRSGQVINISPM